MTVKEFVDFFSSCSYYEKEQVAGDLIDEGLIDDNNWLEVNGITENHWCYDDFDEIFDIIWEGIIEGNQKFLEPYLDEKGEFDYDNLEYDSDELYNFVYSIVKEKMKVEFPKLIEEKIKENETD